MNAYVDTGVLVKLYVSEPNSARAIEAATSLDAVPFTQLHELELRNALRALEGRRTISQDQRVAALQMIEGDVLAGRLQTARPSWPDVFTQAEMLSRNHTASTLARSLDILHVACAVVGEAVVFLTADLRQHRLAELAGLNSMFIE